MYIVADVSYSMAPYLRNLNTGLESLHRKLLSEPMVAAKVRISVLGFSDTVTEYLRRADLRDVKDLPGLSTAGSTSYRAAFEALHSRIPGDVAAMKAENYKVLRPVVFFFSDGLPNGDEDWRSARQRVVDRSVTRAAPNVVAFGIGNEVDAGTILEIATATKHAFVTTPAADIGDAIGDLFSSLTQSVMHSGHSMMAGQAELKIDPPSDTFAYAIDEV